MGEIRGVIPTIVEKEFRELAMRKFGYKKGSISKAIEEALLRWIQTNQVMVETNSEAFSTLKRIQE